MAIRITHGRASTIAQFGIEAGKGEQRVRQAAEVAQTGRSNAAIAAQERANALRMQTDITKTILDAQARREAMEFESFMQGESAKRAIGWEQEKLELRNLHEFEMQEQRKEVENQLAIESDGRQRSKLESKFKALDDAAERGDISPEDAQKEKLRLELGVPGSQSPLFGKKDEASIFADLLAGREKRAADSGTTTKQREVTAQQNATRLLNLSDDLSIPKEDREDMKKAVREGDPAVIKTILDVVEARGKTPSTAKLLDIGASGLVPRKRTEVRKLAFSPLTGS